MFTKKLKRTVAVAPMLDWTDRHCRYFLRIISRQALLYTEMITTGAILKGDVDYLLKYNEREHPLALQLGGSDPADLAQCAQIAQAYGYDEINLNIGCPSDRVQSGRFGACLMAEPELVARCVAAMRKATDIPVTVKTRIGIDDRDSYEELKNFINTVAESGCEIFIVHARKAWLQGLSPKQNREIPPLQYDIVYQLKRDYPQLHIVMNGGIKNLMDAKRHLLELDGVMIGREGYHNPYLLAEVDKVFYEDQQEILSRHEVIEKFLPYVEQQLTNGSLLQHMTRHILGLFQGMPGAKAWRRYLSENSHHRHAGCEVIHKALAEVER